MRHTKVYSKRKTFLAVLGASTLLSCASMQAETIVQYSFATNNFNPVPSNGGAASGATAPYANIVNGSFVSSASTITVGPGDNFGGDTITNITLTYRTSGTFVDQTGGTGPTPGFPTLNAQMPNSTTAFLTPNALIYFGFSFTAVADFYLNSIFFDMSMGSTSSATRGAQVKYSLDGFETSITLGIKSFPTGGTADNYYYFDFDLANALVTAGQTVEFRFEPFSTSGGGVRFDNIGINASPVPEPTALALLGIGGLTALLLRRRQA